MDLGFTPRNPRLASYGFPLTPDALRLTPDASRDTSGFTLLELMIVVSIVGILITLAQPSYQHATTKAREAALKQNLFTLRNVLDQYRADKGEYPPTLEELVSAGYLRRIPNDPLTQSENTWQLIYDDVEGGIFDVHSGSELVATNGTPYNEW